MKELDLERFAGPRSGRFCHPERSEAESRDLGGAIILETLGGGQKIASRRFLAEPALSAAEWADCARNDKTAGSAREERLACHASKDSQALSAAKDDALGAFL